MSPEQPDQAVDETLMVNRISWSMMKFRVKLIEIQIILHHHTLHCTIQCMQTAQTHRIRHYVTELCIGVISTLIDITVALTCTQTRDDGEVYKALKNDPETRQPPITLSSCVTTVKHVHTGPVNKDWEVSRQ